MTEPRTATAPRCANGHRLPVEGGDVWTVCPHCGAPPEQTCSRGHRIPARVPYCTLCGEPAPWSAPGRGRANSYWDDGVPAFSGRSRRTSDPPTHPVASPTGDAGPSTQVLALPAAARPSWLAALGHRIEREDPLQVLFFGGVALLVVALVALLVIPGTPQRQGTSGAEGARRTATTSDGAGRPAAETINALLVQNEPNRALAQNGTQAIGSCGELTTAIGDLQRSASARQDLVSELGTLDVASLPGGGSAVSTLQRAWRDSAASDAAYAQWGQDEAAHGCTADDHGDPSFQAAQAPDEQATAAKDEFVRLWNPIAARYGLPSWQATAL
ncbi:MAG: hypothetical protein ACYDA2_04720 [Acidimicrobiales bacterium]